MDRPVPAGAPSPQVPLVPLELGEGVRAVVTTRAGGVSEPPWDTLNLSYTVGDDPAAVTENRRRVCAALGVEALTVADQQHTARVAVVDEGLAGAGHRGVGDAQDRLPATDALVTDVPGVALACLVADCQPIVLWDPLRRTVGVVHAGRKGTLLGIVPAAVATMAEAYGTDPADLRVAIGPHVAAASYEVGPKEVDEVAAVLADRPDLVDAVLSPTEGGHAHLDLEAIVRAQLADAGVPSTAVASTGIDTVTSTDRFFSHRAARPTGRFAAVAVIDT